MLQGIFMPLPLGTRYIMFFRWSICPSVCLKPEIPSLHPYMGPFIHPTNCDHFFSLCSNLSLGRYREVSRHFFGNSWKEWPAIWHADVSRPPSELIRIWSRSIDFPSFSTTLTWRIGSNLGFSSISQRTMEGMAQNIAWCILTSCRNYYHISHEQRI